MYKNFGDKNFFERGILVDDEHSDEEFDILWCMPYSDEENLYQFGDCHVDIKDDWIDRKAVMEFIGMSEETFNPIQYAIGCIDYYGIENFSSSYTYDQYHMKKEDICEILKYRLIANDNLHIEW